MTHAPRHRGAGARAAGRRRQGGPTRAGPAPRRLDAGGGRHRRPARVRRRGSRLLARRPPSSIRYDRIDAFLTRVGDPTMTGPIGDRVRVARAEARRRPGGAARARRGFRHARGRARSRWPTRSRRRRSRRCGSTTRTAAPVARRPTARRCSTPRHARRRPSSPGGPSWRPSGWCSAAGRWAAATARWSVGDADDPLPALGLLMLSYPLHAAGKPDQPRIAALPRASGCRCCS